MQSRGFHSLLQQTPLSVNPYLDLPKAPTLPHNYASLPSTLPPSSINVASTTSDADLPAYVTSSSGFAAHPSTIIKQNKALLQQISDEKSKAQTKVAEWEQSIKDRDLQEKRRKAPGWLDSSSKMLEPARAASSEQANILDSPLPSDAIQTAKPSHDVDELGAAMDRAFGRSEMG